MLPNGEIDTLAAGVALSLLGLSVIGALWSLVLIVASVAEVQCFGVLRAIGSMIIAGVIAGVIGIVLVMTLGAVIFAALMG